MRVSAGLLAIIAYTGDGEARAIQQEWFREEIGQPFNADIQCYYFRNGDYFALLCPQKTLPKRSSTLVGLPKVNV